MWWIYLCTVYTREEHFCDVAIFIKIGYETLIGVELTQMKNGILVTFSVRV